MELSIIEVNGYRVYKDKQGRFSLNDLRIAGGADDNKLPSRWLKRFDVNVFLKNMKKNHNSKTELIFKKRIGCVPNTFVHKKIALEYAASISATFKAAFLAAITAKSGWAKDERPAICEAPQQNINRPDELIQTDENGRINLNVLFERSGASFYKRPTAWIMQEPTITYIQSLKKSNQCSVRPIHVVWEGLTSIVYAESQLALRYATWVGSNLAFKVSQFLINQNAA